MDQQLTFTNMSSAINVYKLVERSFSDGWPPDPWTHLEAVIELNSPIFGNSRRPYPFVIQDVTDPHGTPLVIPLPAMEDVLYETTSLRQFTCP